MATRQQISYIAPAAPARRQPATGTEPFLRPEIGFTPNWYHTALGIDFGERWHTDPEYRRDSVVAMRRELRRRFPGTRIGSIDQPDEPADVLTGAYGGCVVAAIYGVPVIYSMNNWPACEPRYLSDEEADALAAADLDTNPVFQNLMAQVDWIAAHEGAVAGFINWQGVLNNAYRLRGDKLFYDLVESPDRCRRLFDCIHATMSEAITRLHQRQRATGVEIEFVTVSNCLVNLISPEMYRRFLLPYDCRLAETFGAIAVHNCAWNADPYLDAYATIPHLGYIDMGLDSNLARARELFLQARRAVMYTPMDLANKSRNQIRTDLERIARDYAPCDVVVADIEAGTPDDRVLWFLEMCDALNRDKRNKEKNAPRLV